MPRQSCAPPHFLTHLSVAQLRNFHRPKLEAEMDAQLKLLTPIIITQSKAAKKGPVTFSSREVGELVMVEYSEEHPPLIARVGMNSLLKLYYRRKTPSDTYIPRHKFGTPMSLLPTDGSPFFLGDIRTGDTMFSLENNMFAVPIFIHPENAQDFLVIRSQGKYYVRPAPQSFTAGQTMPKMVVPPPESKKANAFVRDLLNVYILRTFKHARQFQEEASIRVEDIQAAFPMCSEANIRKRLKEYAEFRRGGNETGAWFMRKDVTFLSDAELAAMVTPEQVCAYESMLAARQRLEDMGIGRQAIEASVNAYEEDPESVLADDESKLAPWRLTADFNDCVNGKCLLALSGPGDPTGCNEGFSMLRMTTKPTQTQEGNRLLPKVQIARRPAQGSLAGGEADLRKLKLEEARDILIRSGRYTREELLKIDRWETVSRVRQLANDSEDRDHRFIRHNKSTAAELKEKFQMESQRRFEAQAQTLGNSEIASSDEDESESETEETEQPHPANGNISSRNKASIDKDDEGDEGDTRPDHGGEENDTAGRRSTLSPSTTNAVADGNSKSAKAKLPKFLIIRRYYTHPKTGLRSTEEKVVDRRLIAEYLKSVREDKKTKNRKEYNAEEIFPQQQQQQQREARPKLEEPVAGTPLKPITCSRCKQVGHMRTNKSCPLYVNEEEDINPDASVTLEGTKLSVKLVVSG